MNIRGILRNRVYLSLALIYALSVAVLCFHAPVVQRLVELSPDEVEMALSPSRDSNAAIVQSVVDQGSKIAKRLPAPVVLQPEEISPGAPTENSSPAPIVLDPSEVAGGAPQTLPANFGQWDESQQEGPKNPYANQPQQNPVANFRPIDPNQSQPVNGRAPLWALGSQLSLNVPSFAAELGELLGIVVVIGLAYRFRTRLLIWYAAIRMFIVSRRRGTCIWLGFAIVLVLTLFPPWVKINAYGARYRTQRVKLWHARIDRSPVETTRWQSSEVDYDRMLTEIAVGECFVLALYLTWARSKQPASR